MRLVPGLAVTLFIACGGGNDEASGPTSAGPAEVTLPAHQQEDVGTVVARVGTEKIGSKQFELAAARQPPASAGGLTLEEKEEILDKLITDEILYQEALKQGLYRDPKVRKIMVNLLLRSDVYASVRNSDFSNAELTAFFEANKEEFVVPEKIQIKRIFIKISPDRSEEDAKTLTTQLRAQIKRGADFRDIAAEHSEDPYKRRGGDLGYVSREGKPGVDPAVIARAFELEMDELSEPFLAAGGYNLLLVPNKRERVERTFEQMKGSVLRRLKNERYETLTNEYISGLKSTYPIEIDKVELEAIAIKDARRISLGPEKVRDGAHEDHNE